MSQLLEYIKIALKSIKNNKARSILTMTGIVIGISSVIMIVSVGNAVKTSVVSGMNELFGGQIIVYSMSFDGSGEIYFDDEDMQAIRDKVKNVKGVVTQGASYGTVDTSRKSYTVYAEIGNPDHDFTKSNHITKGRNITWEEYEDGAPVCVIQEQSALNLFGRTDVVGEIMEVNLYDRIIPFRIVGVREKTDSAIMNIVYMEDEVEIEVSLTTVEQATGLPFSSYNSMITILADSPENSTQVATDTVRLLENRKGVRGEDAIFVEEFSSYMDEISTIVNFVTLFISFVAAVSLLVGGIGVMNIMLVSVTERTREIGIRKALGATTGSIMLQFLAEEGMITLIGGIAGMILGWAGGGVICGIASSVSGMSIIAYVDAFTVIGVCAFSSIIGLFFGIYPARKAAKMSPIEALRHE